MRSQRVGCMPMVLIILLNIAAVYEILYSILLYVYLKSFKIILLLGIWVVPSFCYYKIKDDKHKQLLAFENQKILCKNPELAFPWKSWKAQPYMSPASAGPESWSHARMTLSHSRHHSLMSTPAPHLVFEVFRLPPTL